MDNSGNYGKIKFKLKDILDNEKMSKNHLIVISGVRFVTYKD